MHKVFKMNYQKNNAQVFIKCFFDQFNAVGAIARVIGLRTPDGLVLSGSELDKMSDEELTKLIDKVDVCCRIAQHKTKIVDAFKAKGHVVSACQSHCSWSRFCG